MTWSSLSHGTNGLILAYGLTLFALIATLIQQRAGASGFGVADTRGSVRPDRRPVGSGSACRCRPPVAD